MALAQPLTCALIIQLVSGKVDICQPGLAPFVLIMFSLMKRRGRMKEGTVLEALEAEKESLTVHCPTCRLISEVRWQRLPTLRLGDRIETLVNRMRCRRCGGRPASVEASAQSDAPGYACKVY